MSKTIEAVSATIMRSQQFTKNNNKPRKTKKKQKKKKEKLTQTIFCIRARQTIFESELKRETTSQPELKRDITALSEPKEETSSARFKTTQQTTHSIKLSNG